YRPCCLLAGTRQTSEVFGQKVPQVSTRTENLRAAIKRKTRLVLNNMKIQDDFLEYLEERWCPRAVKYRTSAILLSRRPI
ncbi:hypothetical protein GWI33_002348, partial [Rhynchophorus ferrugineus]